MTRREEVLTALHAALAGVAGATVRRNGTDPETIPEGGLVVLRDGDPGEPEVTLSPLTYHYQHRAVIEVMVQMADEAARDAAFDALAEAVGAVVLADRTLGGAVDWLEPEAPAPVEEDVLGAAGIKAAEIGVVLHYAASTPLT